MSSPLAANTERWVSHNGAMDDRKREVFGWARGRDPPLADLRPAPAGCLGALVGGSMTETNPL